MLRTIRKQLVRRSLDMLQELSSKKPVASKEDDSEVTEPDYSIFWENFGKFIKLGLLDDPDNKYPPPPINTTTTNECRRCMHFTALSPAGRPVNWAGRPTSPMTPIFPSHLGQYSRLE